MSSEKGNVKRTRTQKYKNRTVFRNNDHDTSKRTKAINNMEIVDVCKQCKVVIEWKIKYKKYKPLTQPKTCLKCQQKTIKTAYHTLCIPCGSALGACCKCRQSTEVIQKTKKMKPREEVLAMMRKDLKLLPERKRRTFYRYLDTFYGKKKRIKNGFDDCDPEDDEEEAPAEQPEVTSSNDAEDYMEKLRRKLEELGKGLLDMDDDLDDDLDDGLEDETNPEESDSEDKFYSVAESGSDDDTGDFEDCC